MSYNTRESVAALRKTLALMDKDKSITITVEQALSLCRLIERLMQENDKQARGE